MTHDLRILIVDDQEPILADFARLLGEPSSASSQLDDLEALLGGTPARATTRLASYELFYARQGDEAVELVRAAVDAGRAFDVVFTDIQMPPGIDGVEAVARMWGVQPDLEVVLCTAHSDYSWRAIVERLGMSDQLVILRKPFDPIEVRQLAACLTEKSRRGRALAQRVRALEELAAAEVALRMAQVTEMHRAKKFQALGHLSAGIAHEINTPLQYVASSLEFLVDGYSELTGELEDLRARLQAAGLDVPERREIATTLLDIPDALRDATDGITRISKIVQGVRAYAHPGRGSARELFDVNQQIRTAVELARTEYKHDAEIELALGEVPMVSGYANELARTMLSLIVNAAQAIQTARKPGARGTITIMTRVAEVVTIEIADDGVGIPVVDRERVFEPFFTTRPLGQGTGQSLAIARSCIVDGHGGSLTFESEVGRGTTFRIQLPIATMAVSA